jgi:hypothetical protein
MTLITKLEISTHKLMTAIIKYLIAKLEPNHANLISMISIRKLVAAMGKSKTGKMSGIDTQLMTYKID